MSGNQTNKKLIKPFCDSNEWNCQNCKKNNSASVKICKTCGALKPIEFEKHEIKAEKKQKNIANKLAKTGYMAFLLSFSVFLFIVISGNQSKKEVLSPKLGQLLQNAESMPVSSHGIAERNIWKPLKDLCIEQIQKSRSDYLRSAASDTYKLCSPFSYNLLVEITVGSHWNAALAPISEALCPTCPD